MVGYPHDRADHYPLLIAVQRGMGEYDQVVVKRPEEIPSGMFRVLATNFDLPLKVAHA